MITIHLNHCFCAGEPPQKPCKSEFVTNSPMALLGVNPVVFQSRLFWWGAHLSHVCSKGWGAICGAQSLLFQGEALYLWSLSWLYVGHYAWGWVFSKTKCSASTTRLEVALLSSLWASVQLVPVFFRVNCSLCSCRFVVSVGGCKFRLFLRRLTELPVFVLFKPEGVAQVWI